MNKKSHYQKGLSEMKKALILLAAGILSALTLTGCSSDPENTLIVANYGKYMEEDIREQFKKETGITIKYDECETPEDLYTKYKSGSIDYDLMCTSEYIIQKLMNEGELLEIDFDNVPGLSNLDPQYLEFSKAFDPENKYTMPYFFGTVGILYNKDMVSAEDVKSWSCLWNEKYKDQIIMTNSVRDAFLAPLKYLGYSVNTTDESQLKEAQKLLITQASLVQAYMVDEAQDEMVAENAAMALVYSGEAALAIEQNEKLAYSVPEEGSNMWIDSWFIPKTCKHKENAEKFLDFLCREDIAAQNFEYVYYATPNLALYNSLDEDVRENDVIFPSTDILNNCEILKPLGEEPTKLYNTLWKEIKASN